MHETTYFIYVEFFFFWKFAFLRPKLPFSSLLIFCWHITELRTKKTWIDENTFSFICELSVVPFFYMYINTIFQANYTTIVFWYHIYVKIIHIYQTNYTSKRNFEVSLSWCPFCYVLLKFYIFSEKNIIIYL